MIAGRRRCAGTGPPVVIVGDVGLHLNRTPFYEQELSLRFARSYGPGRYEPSYEAWGVDYPAGQVRWTEGRNFEAVLDLLAAGRLQVADLVTHTFGIGEAAARLPADRGAHRALPGHPAHLPAGSRSRRPRAARRLQRRRPDGPPAHHRSARGSAGSGRARSRTGTLLPAFRAAGFSRFTAIASASGLSRAPRRRAARLREARCRAGSA